MSGIKVGGQAVIEGILMKTPWSYSVAIRQPNGNIQTIRRDFKSFVYRYNIHRIPILRGVVTMLEVICIGIWALSFSADVAMEDEKNKKKSNLSNALFMTVTLVGSFGFALLLFFFLPLFLVSNVMQMNNDNVFVYNLLAGGIRIFIFLCYLWIVSSMNDIRRVFEYHGAEHKTIANYESGEPLSVEAAGRFSRFHPRCGTSFLFMVLVVAIVVFSIGDAIVIHLSGHLTFIERLGYHFLYIPLISGAGYEVIRLAAQNRQNRFLSALIYPGLLLQKLTTREPDNSQLQIAICALEEALKSVKPCQKDVSEIVL